MGADNQKAPEDARGDHAEIVPTRTEIQCQLQQILDSADLKRSSRLGDFLAYVVEETLEGRQDRIKAYSIGIEVLGRDASFDPQLDPVVRIEAGRLRRELERYYLTVGKNDPVGIEIPKGGYVPRFHVRATAAGGRDIATPDLPRPVAGHRPLGAGFDWRSWRLTGTLTILAALFGAVWLVADIDRRQTAASAAVADIAAQPSILILPFANLGGGVDVDQRGAAIVDELTARLVRFREVTIVSTSQADGAAASDPKARPAARYLLDGSVRTDGTRLRVTARLADRASGTVLWSEVYDLDLKATDAIALEQDIASRVADAVAQPYGVLFRPGGRPSKMSSGGIADGYQCALEFYRYRGDLGAEMHARVRTCLQRSVADTPNNATAWAMLSYMYLDEDRFGYNRIASPPAIGRALLAARRAIQLDPTNVRGLQALMTALFFNREPDEALRVGEQAYRLNPDDTELLGEYGSRLMQAGQRRRGMVMMEDALARNPANTGLYVGLLAVGVYLDGDDKRALSLIRRSDLQHFSIYHFMAALIFARNGLADEAAASREAFLKMRPDFFAHFDAELDKRNFNAEDRAKLVAGAREAGFPVSPGAIVPAPRAPVTRAY